MTDNSWWYRILKLLPQKFNVFSIGEWLINNKLIQKHLKSTDLYIIDSRI